MTTQKTETAKDGKLPEHGAASPSRERKFEGRLDDETQRLIERAVFSGCPAMLRSVCRYCDATQDALSARILELQEIARKENDNK